MAIARARKSLIFELSRGSVVSCQFETENFETLAKRKLGPASWRIEGGSDVEGGAGAALEFFLSIKVGFDLRIQDFAGIQEGGNRKLGGNQIVERIWKAGGDPSSGWAAPKILLAVGVKKKLVHRNIVKSGV